MGTQGFENLIGQHRLLVVVAPSAQDPGYTEQLDLLTGQEAGLDTRDLVVVHLTGGPSSRAGDKELDPDTVLDLLDRCEVDGDVFATVLLGYDGSSAHRADAPVDPDTLFALVDSMTDGPTSR